MGQLSPPVNNIIKRFKMTYNEFKKDILISFNRIIEKYNFKLVEDPEESGWYLLKNESCILSLGIDRGEIICSLKNYNYDFIDIKQLYSKVADISLLPITKDPWSFTNQLNRYVIMLENSYIANLLCEN